MPKIPLYNRGVGPTVELPTGKLSPRLSAEALTQPALQMARLGQQVGQAGRQFAENQIAYQKQKAQIDFQFKKAEQDRESVRIGNELVREFRDLSDNHILSTQQKHTNTTSASDDFDATITQSAIKRIDELEVTDRQRESIRTSVLNSLSPYASAAKKNAYNHGLAVFKAEHDEAVQNQIDTIPVDATAEELTAIVTDLEQQSREAIGNGATPKIAPELVRSVVAETYADKRIVAATSVDEIDRIMSGIEDAPVAKNVKTRLRGAANVRRAAIQKEINDGIISDINMLDPNLIGQQNFADAAAAIRANATQVTLYAETPTADGKLVKAYQIDLTGADASMRSRTISALNGLQAVAENEANTSVIDSVRTAVPDMSLSEVNTQLELARRGEGLAAGLEGTALSGVIGVLDAELGRREGQVLTTVQQNTKDITASITANRGQVTPETQALINQTSDLYGSIGRDAEASAFVAEVAAIQKAGVTFSGIQFATDKEIQATIVKETAALAKVPVEQAAEARASLDALNKMVEQRDAAMQVDPVGYLELNKGPLSVSERINLQRQMGVAEVNIRLASTAEIKSFKEEYDFAENYAEKARIGNEFIQKFGAGNETMVLRNLMNQGVINVVDNLVIANPDNPYMFAVEAANAPTSIESFKQRLTKDQRDSTTTAVRAELEEYSNSIIGGGFDDVLSRTATDKRAAHVFAMADIVQNTAMYYQSISNISPEDAAKKAAEAVIGSQYAFTTVNNSQIRLKKGLEAVAEPIGAILQSSISESNRDYLTSIIDIPSKVGIESAITDDEYVSDLIARGRWVTTTDNSGVYLVDQTGNMVRRKRDPQMPPEAQEEFIVVPFSSLMGSVREIQESESVLGELFPGPDRTAQATAQKRAALARRIF
jgi:hypothetical protein